MPAAFLMATARCGSIFGPDDSPYLRANATNVILVLGESTELGVTLQDGITSYHTAPTGSAPPFPSSIRVSWSSEQPAVAAADSLGRVTALSPGRATIRVSARGLRDTLSVFVVAKPDTASFVTMNLGAAHGCGISALARGYCWGSAWFGALTGGPVRRYTATVAPERVRITDPLVSIAAGTNQTCAATTDGTVWCWGDNGSGATGDAPEPGPVRVHLSQRATAVGAFAERACALTVPGRVQCWPLNRRPQAPLGPPTGAFASLAVGLDHTCALDSAGAAFCWGSNNEGQLGVGDVVGRTTPTAAVTTERFASLAAGARYTCGVTQTGHALCWGSGISGQLGTGTDASSTVPVPVLTQETFVSISAGSRHTCGVTASGKVLCWGLDDRGQLGDGPHPTPNPSLSDLISLSPVQARSNETFAQVFVSSSEVTCALTRTSKAFCWGTNLAGVVGVGRKDFSPGLTYSRFEQPVPVRMPPGAQ